MKSMGRNPLEKGLVKLEITYRKAFFKADAVEPNYVEGSADAVEVGFEQFSEVMVHEIDLAESL